MSNQICLKWNSFLNNIATSFESLWEEEGLVDVTLASDGQCLTAHKVILSASSPFFKKVFQTNPCRHPVIILQDVRFRELEALLIFIYKGEVNIEQQNLPALLKAADTLKIRGLSGGDVFANQSYKRFVDLDAPELSEEPSQKEETPKKKQKVSKKGNNSILEKALTPQVPQLDATNETIALDPSFDDANAAPDPVLLRLEMKAEPIELSAEDFESKRSPTRKEANDRLDTGQTDPLQGPSKATLSVIAEARDTSVTQGNERLRQRLLIAEDTPDPVTGSIDAPDLLNSPNEIVEPLNFPSDRDPSVSQPAFPSHANPSNSTDPTGQYESSTRHSYPPFPCPFCDRAYTSWGFRRRHIKAVHTMSPSLNCKWCLQVLPTHTAWRRHVVSAHNLSPSDAHNGLLILEEAHMVLQIARPTRLDTLVNIIKENSRQQSTDSDSTTDRDKE